MAIHKQKCINVIGLDCCSSVQELVLLILKGWYISPTAVEFTALPPQKALKSEHVVIFEVLVATDSWADPSQQLRAIWFNPYNDSSQEHFPCCHQICHRLLACPLYGCGTGNWSHIDFRGVSEDCSHVSHSSSLICCSGWSILWQGLLSGDQDNSLPAISLPKHHTCLHPVYIRNINF